MKPQRVAIWLVAIGASCILGFVLLSQMKPAAIRSSGASPSALFVVGVVLFLGIFMIVTGVVSIVKICRSLRKSTAEPIQPPHIASEFPLPRIMQCQTCDDARVIFNELLDSRLGRATNANRDRAAVTLRCDIIELLSRSNTDAASRVAALFSELQ